VLPDTVEQDVATTGGKSDDVPVDNAMDDLTWSLVLAKVLDESIPLLHVQARSTWALLEGGWRSRRLDAGLSRKDPKLQCLVAMYAVLDDDWHSLLGTAAPL